MIVLSPYELPVAVAGSLNEAKVKEALEDIKNLITDSKGEIGEVEEWGKKNLSFPILKEKTAFYFLVNFEADSKTIPNLSKKLMQQVNTLRFLVIKKDTPKKLKHSLRSSELKEKKAKASKEAKEN